jgi:secreted trypsin-like serine protease
MKKFLSVFLLISLSLPAISQKVTVQVIKSGEAALSGWQILDERYMPVYSGENSGNETTFSLEANKRYFFAVSINGNYTGNTALFTLVLSNEPLILVGSDTRPGDHFFPFFTGLRTEVTKITGGTTASISDFPWQVYVIAGNVRCGGSIIAPDWIMTAAHCTKDASNRTFSPSVVSIMAGATNPPVDGVRYEASEVIPNENFNDVTLENDIALIRLKVPINTANARPIKLVNSDDVFYGATDPGVMSWVTGWGLIHVAPNVFPTTLQKVQLPLITNSQASTVWKSIPSTVLMAGYLNGNKDACSGDSGGPLVVPVIDEYKLAGVVSWGSQECDTYGAYTRVSLFESWIRSKTGIVALFEPPIPSGDSIVCKGQLSTRYTVSTVSGVTGYEWKLLPANAGSITSSQTSTIISWNSSFLGSATLAYRVTRNGTLSDWSRFDLKVVPDTRFISQSRDTTVCAGQHVTLKVTAEGYNLNYRWFKEGTLLVSSPSSQFDLLAPGVSNSGNYTVEIEGSCGTLSSGIIKLTVLPLTKITRIPSAASVPFGSDFTFQVTTEGHNLTYQWEKDGVLIQTSQSSDLQLSDLNAADIGLYSITATGTCGTVKSDSIYLYVSGKSVSGGPDVFLWPSVTSDIFNIAIRNDDLYNVQIVNTMGQVIRSYKDLRYQTEINVSALPKGAYIIIVYNKDFRKALRLVKF